MSSDAPNKEATQAPRQVATTEVDQSGKKEKIPRYTAAELQTNKAVRIATFTENTMPYIYVKM